MAPKALRFGNQYRLKRSSEFLRVRTEGTTCVGRWMILGSLRPILPTNAVDSPSGGIQAVPRFGVVTSRRVGSAVVRNKFRRRIRHIHQAHLARLSGAPWLVVIARHPASRASFAQLEAEWRNLARKAGLLLP